MDTVLKTFTGIFLLLLLTAVSVGLIGATLSVNAAEMFYSEVSKKISVSNFSNHVIEECVTDARNHGYGLSIDTSEVNKSGKKVGKGKMIYTFSVPILNIQKEYQIESNIW